MHQIVNYSVADAIKQGPRDSVGNNARGALLMAELAPTSAYHTVREHFGQIGREKLKQFLDRTQPEPTHGRRRQQRSDRPGSRGHRRHARW